MRREHLDELHPAATVDTARNGKDPASGRFVAGNRLASNRRSRARWNEAFDRGCSPDDMEKIVRKAVQQAKGGDRFAREWLGEFALQRPPRMLDLDVAMDGGEHTEPEPDLTLYE